MDGLAKAGRGGDSISRVATAAAPAEGAAAGTEGKDHRGAGIWSGKLDWGTRLTTGVADVDGLAKVGRGWYSISRVAGAADPAEGEATGVVDVDGLAKVVVGAEKSNTLP